MLPIIPGIQMPLGRQKYPFDELEVSVLDPETGDYTGPMFFVARAENNLLSHVANTSKKLGKKFLTRMIYMRNGVQVNAETEGAVLGVGVWRIA